MLFAEDGDDAAGRHVFARELPPRKHRAASGISITVASEQPPEGTDPTSKIYLAFEARADVRRDAEAMLRDVFRVLVMPGGHPWHMPPLIHAGSGGTVMTGVIGPPPAENIDAEDGAAVWRVLAIEATQPVTPTAVEASARATEEGQGAAECALAFTVVPHSIAQPVAAATLHHDGSGPPGGVNAAQVRVRAAIRVVAGVARTAALALEYRTSTDGGATWTTGSLDMTSYASVADLVAAMPAGWSTAPGAAGARSPLEVAFLPWTDALLAANERTLRVWA